ncbi:MAG: DNA internalization-related competence protein ComEC/Rec2 [Chloroflexota bacterium]
MPRSGWLALGAVACGVACGAVPAPSQPLLLLLLAACVASAAAMTLVRRTAGIAVTVGAASVLARLLLGGLAAEPVAPPPAGATEGPWVAQVVTLGSTDGGQQRSVLLVSAPDSATGTGGRQGPWRTYAWLPRYPALVPGDRIAFDEPLEPVRHDGSEFAAYLDGIGAVATTRIRDVALVGDQGGLLGVAESIRRLADEALARVVPEPMAGLASAILVGRRDRVAREVTDAFTATGLSHVVAISGWNIALIGGVIGGLLAAMGLGRRQRTIAIVVALGAFTLLAGGGASVVRAALMGGVVLVAREMGRPGTAAAALGLATWCLLLLDPAMASDIGFQLSVAATAGLLAWGSRLTQRLLGSGPGPVRRWLGESLGVSLAAQAATLPLVLLHFGRLSLVSPLANLVIAPLVAPAMLVGSLCLVAGLVVGAGVPAILAAPFAVLGWAVLGSMVAVAGAFAGLPYASVELAPAVATASAVAMALAVGGVAWRARGSGTQPSTSDAVVPRRDARTLPARTRRLVMCAAGVAMLLVGAGVLVRAVTRDARLVVTALDVGQGDSILVEGPRGGRLLLDGGPDPDRLLLVLDRHVPAWDRRIDLVILTHPHEDHVAGLAMLLARYRVAGIAENGMLGAGPGDAAFRQRLAAMGVTTSRLAAGDHLTLDGIRLDVRWPIRGEVPARSPSEGRRINDTSVVLDLRFGERRILLTGDIEDDVDPRLLSAGIGDDDRLDVLKVAHHGSGTATSEAWLDALRPRVALVSAGTGNPYGHPAPRTIERLETHGARVLRTDLDGDLEVSTDGHDLRVATSGGRSTAAAWTSTSPTTRNARRTIRGAASPAPVAAVGAPTVATGLFLCAIPLPVARLAALGAPEAPHPAQGRRVPAAAPPPMPGSPTAGDPPLPCYDRTDDDPLTAGGGRTVALAPAGDGPPGALHGHRGRRVVPGGGDGSRGPPGRPHAGRDRVAAA